MRLNPRAALALATGLLVSGGCDSALGVDPAEVAGTYVLEAVAGSPLPAVVMENEDFMSTVLADTFRFSGDGTGRQSVRTRLRLHATGVTENISFQQQTFGYRIRGARIEITYVCAPNALCLPGPHLIARPTADGLRIEGEPGDFDYRRLEP
ncbi:MAG TPA: hypothetical protein VFX98_13880 [Longimicrobiaceae bacterium]|nr:hypothetical protein [Longimicrobiaceae bacterium]